MSDRIAPALTPEEWRKLAVSRGGFYADLSGDWQNGIPTDTLFVGSPESAVAVSPRHALAALALHGQPFGFTREDVANLRWVACQRMPRAAALNQIADRIEALLPPP